MEDDISVTKLLDHRYRRENLRALKRDTSHHSACVEELCTFNLLSSMSTSIEVRI
ncbi:hypothetical protein GcM3_126015 [Golovinomyces cichoracearum]|uniref:Uncharacterized protein n=1 Tax=Golovinomyces cichoracearum TaxID=62708 RepID=A0A420I5Z2_9PEZI|nr:hypothetical protein GcM3_126015 [Golovinomyces cichoracearum]